MFAASHVRVLILVFVLGLLASCFLLEVSDSFLHFFLFRDFLLQSDQLSLLVLVGLDRLGLAQFLRVHCAGQWLDPVQLTVLLGGEAWNLEFFSLVFQGVLVHVVNVSDRKLRAGTIQTLLHVLSDATPHNHLVQDVDDSRSLRWLNGEHLTDEVTQTFAIHLVYWRVRTPEDLYRETVNTLRVERVPQVTHLVEDAAESPHIRLIAVWFVLKQLGRHVVWRSNARLRKVFR